MKRITMLITLMAMPLSLLIYAQEKGNLSDNFAKAGLRALLAMETDTSLGDRSDSPEQQMAYHATVERLNDADVEAQTDAEKAVMKLLRSFSVKREILKLSEAMSASNTRMMARSGSSGTGQDPQLTANEQSVKACGDAIEKVLRDRKFPGSLPACESK